MHAGGFTAADIHSWLGGVLPGIPRHLPSSSSSSCLLFKQQETGMLLGCIYGQGQATFMWWVAPFLTVRGCSRLVWYLPFKASVLHSSLLALASYTCMPQR
jgi:hypothetical protein